MKEKILQKLKTSFSSLGLSNDVLTATAEALVATGLVTDENLDTIVASQRPMLESVQKENDRRVGQATEKTKTEVEKKFEQQILELNEQHKKQLDDLKKDEKPKAAPVSTPTPVKENGNAIPSWYTAEREGTQKQLKELTDMNAKLLETISAMQTENAAAKAASEAAKRSQFIIDKAKELGVPQFRIDEGFSIAADADDNAITQYLSAVANNAKAQQLPTSGASYNLANASADKAMTDEIAKSLIL